MYLNRSPNRQTVTSKFLRDERKISPRTSIVPFSNTTSMRTKILPWLSWNMPVPRSCMNVNSFVNLKLSVLISTVPQRKLFPSTVHRSPPLYLLSRTLKSRNRYLHHRPHLLPTVSIPRCPPSSNHPLKLQALQGSSPLSQCRISTVLCIPLSPKHRLIDNSHFPLHQINLLGQVDHYLLLFHLRLQP